VSRSLHLLAKNSLNTQRMETTYGSQMIYHKSDH